MRILPATLALLTVTATAATARGDGEAKNVIFFLGDGMGPTVVTAARIYRYGEKGKLHMETLPRTARIRTYSEDGQTTDSAPSMAAYMTGVKMKNEVISMTPDTKANKTGSNNTVNNCGAAGTNGAAVTTLFEMAKARGKVVGAVTSTRITHATPATTYSHICHRDLENHIAAQLVPSGDGYNTALDNGVDVLFGGGRRHFLPTTITGGLRTDDRDLTDELKKQGYTFVADRAGFDTLDPAATRVVGLFTMSHMTYDLDRKPEQEPSLAEMTAKAIDILARDPDGYVLMVEGGRIDHALHDTIAIKALQDAVAFDDAIQVALGKVDLRDTLIVVTADHDHTMVINGYSRHAGPTTATKAGVVGVVYDLVTGMPSKDADDRPYTVLSFGNGDNRVTGARSSKPELTDDVTSAKTYHQEAAILRVPGDETHGGGDVMLMAGGAGSSGFKGTMVNTKVFGLIVKALGL